MAAPGAALIRENLPDVSVVEDPTILDLDRLARSGCREVFLLFGLETLGAAAGAARHLRRQAVSVTALRGHVVPDELLDDFDALNLDTDPTALLLAHATPPSTWRHPL